LGKTVFNPAQGQVKRKRLHPIIIWNHIPAQGLFGPKITRKKQHQECVGLDNLAKESGEEREGKERPRERKEKRFLLQSPFEDAIYLLTFLHNL